MLGTIGFRTTLLSMSRRKKIKWVDQIKNKSKCKQVLFFHLKPKNLCGAKYSHWSLMTQKIRKGSHLSGTSDFL